MKAVFVVQGYSTGSPFNNLTLAQFISRLIGQWVSYVCCQANIYSYFIKKL